MPRAPLSPLLSPLLLLALVPSACGRASTPSPAVSPSPLPPASSSETPAVAEVDCGAPIEGADEVLRPGGLVLLGELHGTRQIPAFVADLACAAATSGISVEVGIELPRGQSEAIASYLEGEGTEADREALLDAEHWQRPDQDGRASVATMALIERVRQLRRAGLDIELFPFDVDAVAKTEWNERDSAMASRILEHAAEAETLVLTLSGNLHNRTAPGLPWNADAVPMGVVVQQARPDVVSLDVRYAGGTAWVCMPECGPAEVRGGPEGEGRSITLWPEPNEYGNHGVFSVGSIEAAVPAAGTPPS